MKVCGICKTEKDESDFHRNKTKRDGLQTKCKQCQTAYIRRHYLLNKTYYLKKARASNIIQFARNRKLLPEYLSTHPCVDCGEHDPIVLEFDHVRGKKLNSISILAYSLGASSQRIQDEIAKCEVRCANCHRRKTAIQFGWGRDTSPAPVAVELKPRQLFTSY